MIDLWINVIALEPRKHHKDGCEDEIENLHATNLAPWTVEHQPELIQLKIIRL